MSRIFRSFVLFILLLLVVSAAVETVKQAKLQDFMNDFIQGNAGNRYTNLDAAKDFAERDVQLGELKARVDLLEASCIAK